MRTIESNQGRIVIPIDFQQFYTTLIHKGYVKPVFKIYPVYIPAGYTLDFTVFTPAGTYFLFVEDTITVFPDHALEVFIYVDNDLILHDPDVVQDRYREPINYLRRYGAIAVAKNSFRIVAINNSSQTAYLSDFSSYGLISKELFETIYETFFEVISSSLHLP